MLFETYIYCSIFAINYIVQSKKKLENIFVIKRTTKCNFQVFKISKKCSKLKKH